MSKKSQSPTTDPDRGNSFQTYLLAAGLFICSTIFFAGVPVLTPIFRVLWWEYLAFGLLAGSAGLTVSDQGFQQVWLYVFALGAGCGIHLGGIGIGGEMPGLPFRLLWAGVIGIGTAAILGTLGGVIGLGLRRLTRRNGSAQ